MTATGHEIAGLYAILDLPHRAGLEPESVLDAMLEGGAAVIQLRSKQARLDPALVDALARRCVQSRVLLIINDDLELAEAGIPGVTGVHLGQGDLERLGRPRQARRAMLRERGLCLGVSTHDLAQLRAALDELAPDYVGFGPVFSTATKPDHERVVGLDGLAEACALSTVPVVAIGGIELERVASVLDQGAGAVATIGALIADSADLVRERSFALSTAISARS